MTNDPAQASDAATHTHDAASTDAAVPSIQGLTLRANVQPITRAQDALPSVFIPPYVSCAPPLPGEPPGQGPNGQVCTNVAISGCTEAGRKFADYASCAVVMTQRPFYPTPPAGTSKPDDPRLQDQAYLAELSWISSQVEASGCACCHDSQVLGKAAGEWDIRLGPLWIDSLSDSGLALFSGLADSSVLGAYDAAHNNGFERDVTGLPSTDGARMQRFMFAELARRGISQDQARAVPPFGGPIYQNRIAVPTACGSGEGVAPDGTIVWNGAGARYVYVMRDPSDNPGVPPNLDLPDGTLFRLDVLASQPALASGIPYGTTPPGSFQAVPEAERAPPLQPGTSYHLYVLEDVGLPRANCLFTFGDPIPAADAGAIGPVMVDAGQSDATAPSTDAGACALPDNGFGTPCQSDDACTCAADYCAVMPGQTTGYCSKTGCNQDASLCPSGWSCLDLSLFLAGLPAICTK